MTLIEHVDLRNDSDASWEKLATVWKSHPDARKSQRAASREPESRKSAETTPAEAKVPQEGRKRTPEIIFDEISDEESDTSSIPTNRKNSIPRFLILAATTVLILVVGSWMAFFREDVKQQPDELPNAPETKGKLAGYGGIVQSLLFSSDGQSLFAAGTDGVAIWNGEKLDAVRIAGKGQKFKQVSQSKNGKLLVGTGESNIVWDLATLNPVFDFAQAIPDCDSFGEHASISNDGRLIAIGCREKTSQSWIVRVVNLESKEKVREFRPERKNPIPWVSFARNDECVFSYTDQIIVDKSDIPGYIGLWDMASGKLTKAKDTYYAGFYYSASVTEDGSAFLLGTTINGFLWRPDLSEMEALKSFNLSHKAVLTADRKSILGVARLSGLVRFNIETNEKVVLADISLSDSAQNCFSLSADKQRVVTADGSSYSHEKPSVRVYNAITGKHIYSFSGHDSMVTAVAMRPDGMAVASADKKTGVLFWSVP